MSLYYRLEDPTDLRDLAEAMPAWIAAGNPKAAAWAPAPPKPSDDAIWNNGQWETPAPATYTAAEWVEQHLTSTQLHALSDLRLSLVLAGKPLGPLMQSLRDWTSQLIVASAADPSPRPSWPAAPCSYEAASAEAVQDLSQ
jgi:hypothetical protein